MRNFKKLRFIYKKKHKARTKDAAEPDIKNTKTVEKPKRDKTRLWINKQDLTKTQ